MKERILTIILFVAFLFTACGGDTGDDSLEMEQVQTVEDTIPTLQGRFIYLADAAVLKGDDFIYGVTLDSLGLELVEKVEPYKKESFDMVPVKVRARILQNPGQKGWDEFIEIREILEAPVKGSALEDKASEE